MARNSFQIKTWTATLFTAVIVLTYSILNILIFIVLIFTTLMFWILDSYYLRQERLFRQLYTSKVNEYNEKNKSIKNPFDMDVKNFKKYISSTFRVIFSISEGLYYVAFLLVLLAFLSAYLIFNL